MANLQGVKFNLPERAKFCFNDSRGNLKKIFSSDQLFSSIINCASLLYSKEKVSELITLFRDDKFAISSLFYGLDIQKHDEESELNKSLYFLPKPYSPIFTEHREVQEDELVLRKRAKRLTYITTDVFKNLLKEWRTAEKRFDFDLTDLGKIGESFAYDRNELDGIITDEELRRIRFMTTQTVQKLLVNRETNSSDHTFYQDVMELSTLKSKTCVVKPFLYFMYRGVLEKEILASLRLMADEGIGGQRSKGMGYFTSVEQVELPLEDREQGDYCISLSVVFPEEKDLQHVISYQLSERSGFIYDNGGTSYRRCTTRVMNEGCIFENTVKGKIVNVTPDLDNTPFEHDILLNGKPFLLAFGGKQE